MANTFPCPNPSICGVVSHVAGSESARLCSQGKGAVAAQSAMNRLADVSLSLNPAVDSQAEAVDSVQNQFAQYPSDRERWSAIREETDYRDNAVGIDPPDCGCTDCLVGNSIQADRYSSRASVLVEQFYHPNMRRPISNRTDADIYAVAEFRDGDDEDGGYRSPSDEDHINDVYSFRLSEDDPRDEDDQFDGAVVVIPRWSRDGRNAVQL